MGSSRIGRSCQLGNQRPQPTRRRQPRVGQWNRHPRARQHDPERTAVSVAGTFVADVQERVRVIAGSRKEPRLDNAPATHPLDPPGALRQPHVTQAAAEQAALTGAGRLDPQRAEALIDQRRIDSLAIIAAAQLMAPAQQRRRTQRTQPRTPRPKERLLGRGEREHDPARRAARRGDRRVRVGHQLGDDLHKVNAALREVLTKVAATHATDAHSRRRNRHRTHPASVTQAADRTSDASVTDPSERPPIVRATMSKPTGSLRVSNPELATVRDAMRELNRMLAKLEAGELEKIVLTQHNQMRAVLITPERYSQLEQRAA